MPRDSNVSRNGHDQHSRSRTNRSRNIFADPPRQNNTVRLCNDLHGRETETRARGVGRSRPLRDDVSRIRFRGRPRNDDQSFTRDPDEPGKRFRPPSFRKRASSSRRTGIGPTDADTACPKNSRSSANDYEVGGRAAARGRRSDRKWPRDRRELNERVARERNGLASRRLRCSASNPPATSVTISTDHSFLRRIFSDLQRGRADSGMD